jgi:hypothetical protein
MLASIQPPQGRDFPDYDYGKDKSLSPQQFFQPGEFANFRGQFGQAHAVEFFPLFGVGAIDEV